MFTRKKVTNSNEQVNGQVVKELKCDNHAMHKDIVVVTVG